MCSPFDSFIIAEYASELHSFRLAQQWQAEAEKFKQWAEQWQSYQIAQLPNAQDVVVQQLQAQIQQLEQQLQYGWQAFEAQSNSLADAAKRIEEKDDEIRRLVQLTEQAKKSSYQVVSDAAQHHNLFKGQMATRYAHNYF